MKYKMLYINITVVMVILLILAGIQYIRHAPIPEDTQYIGSVECKSCHRKEYKTWKDSLHAKMMRPAADDGVIVASFSVDDGAIQFDQNDAIWAIGSKWEQQFMGHDGETETLLPGSWKVSLNQWDKKNWDGWQVPTPKKRCHGCHTVGLNAETGEFVEPSIGCESCHGPGEWHANTDGHGKIVSLLDAQVCGQCHSRGKSKNGEYFFPVGYRPGKQLSDHFDEYTPDPLQNSSFWWANGRERKRHQEYFAWRQGGHADSMKSLVTDYDGRFGKLSQDCLRCHAAEAILNPDKEYSVNSDLDGITCSVCHNVHGKLDDLRMSCESCHEKGAFYHTPDRNANHVACGNKANVDCVNCHMPLTAKNGGGYTLHSHTPGIVEPKESTKLGVPTSCANGGCHNDKETEWLQLKYTSYYVSLNDDNNDFIASR